LFNVDIDHQKEIGGNSHAEIKSFTVNENVTKSYPTG
jgi:hypothetical protein